VTWADAQVLSHRSGFPVPVTATSRQMTARRLTAARVLAGNPSLRSLADRTGMSYGHWLGISKGSEPLLPTDVRDLAAVLQVRASWLAHGWNSNGAAV
jgi:hypothetical protein